MTPRPLLLVAFLVLAAASCDPAQPQQGDLCPAPPCAPGAASLGAICGPALDGVCSAAGTCLPPCVHASDCASLAAGAGEVAACDAVSAACTYVVATAPQGAGI